MRVTLTPAQIRTALQGGSAALGAGQFTWSLPTAASVWPDYDPGDEPFDGFVLPTAALGTALRTGLALWDGYILPDFTEVADNADGRGEIRIAFTAIADEDTFGYAYQGPPQRAGGPVGDIWIANDLTDSDFAPGSYNYEAILHEIGHTLGLKHSFEAPRLAAEYDTGRYTVMSYTQPADRVVRFVPAAGGGLAVTSGNVVASTPMVLDIAAVQAIYGADPDTAAGNTSYTFDPSDASLRTIYDAGGIDTLDLSAITRPNQVDLTPGAYSSIAIWSREDQIAYWSTRFPDQARSIRTFLTDFKDLYTFTDNLGIALSTVIENAIGGAVGDVLTGNDAANILDGRGGVDTLAGGAGDDLLIGGTGADRMTGGTGNDVFRGTHAEFSNDTIVDLAVGDRIHVTDPGVNFWVKRAGGLLTFSTGEILTLANGAGVVLRPASEGGLEIRFRQTAVEGDWNGDGRSDVLWRNASGYVTDWFAADYGFTGATGFGIAVGTEWQIAGNGDFNADGRADILWRSAGGYVTQWLSTGTGFDGATGFGATVSADWKVAGTGDFDGDGRSDILWRNDNGRITTWASTGTGFNGATGVDYYVGGDWKVAGTGDFDGDGRDDILWRNDNGRVTVWKGTATGFDGATGIDYQLTADWKVAGTGDINGDGRDDILWRNDAGRVTNWFATAGGGFAQGGFSIVVATAWSIVDIGDYNGDNRADILWRNTDGSLARWVSNSVGFEADPSVGVTVPTDWTVFG